MTALTVEALAEAGASLGRSIEALRQAMHRFANGAVVLRYALERQRAMDTYRTGLVLQGPYPERWEVFCVTTSEGRCRVISRPRGGWS